jgi:hypothetical protein
MAPPLTLSEAEAREGLGLLIDALTAVDKQSVADKQSATDAEGA